MPYSYKDFKKQVKVHFLDYIPLTTRILDVGPGSGTYGKMLRPAGYKVDCLEIWQPYVEKYKLSALYNNVFVGDILEFDIKGYDYVILGDILEHISLDKAQMLIREITAKKINCLVAVPFEFEQGISDHNIYEIHLQSDLTLANVLIRYPELSVLYSNDRYGYFINYIPKRTPKIDRILKKIFGIYKNIKIKMRYVC